MFQLGNKVRYEFLLDYQFGVGLVKAIDANMDYSSVSKFTLLYDEANMPYVCGLNADDILVCVAKVPEAEKSSESFTSSNEFLNTCEYSTLGVKDVKKFTSTVVIGAVAVLLLIGIWTI